MLLLNRPSAVEILIVKTASCSMQEYLVNFVFGLFLGLETCCIKERFLKIFGHLFIIKFCLTEPSLPF